jgi:hypothetical protein
VAVILKAPPKPVGLPHAASDLSAGAMGTAGAAETMDSFPWCLYCTGSGYSGAVSSRETLITQRGTIISSGR